MGETSNPSRRRITIAIMALGGQGGGVLADWIIAMATRENYVAQGTSVPGVAQRTGATIYYIELFPKAAHPPILALSPMPGDVNIVIAAELMEAGRAILRGFVDQDRTTLIASTHRIYAISEKSAMGDGIANRDYVLNAARTRARNFVGFDMEFAAERAGSMISPVLFGALAASGALPFSRESFEAAIRDSAIAVGANLKGFAAGFVGEADKTTVAPSPDLPPSPQTQAGRKLQARIEAELRKQAWAFAIEGVRRLLDYQDAAYAELYLDRLGAVAALDTAGPDRVLTRETARHLALWMSYEDTIRVADLKTRRSRIARVHEEVRALPDQVVHVTEFMHPRLEEICETMPAWVGRHVLRSKTISALLSPLFRQGRHVTSTRLGWFLILYFIAGLRPWRRGTLRYRQEQARIDAWLALACDAAKSDAGAALELVQSQGLIKGYGDTFARGLKNFDILLSVYRRFRNRPDCAATLRGLREAALKDEEGHALSAALMQFGLAVDAA
ncbi:MAG: indolepyruvate oxidoreductase subunit beta family protein [Pseudomonadota bacterium]